PWLTIVGEGGVGKTRLALTVAATVQADFPDGVWFVPLAGVTPGVNLADRLAVAVGAALNLTFVNIESLTAQLFAQLRNKQLLLLLDNFEHLVDGAEFVLDLLQEIPALKVLVTSRQRLDFQAEYIFVLDGLPVPEDEGAPFEKDEFLAYESVALFVERASRTNTAFEITQQDQPAVIRICRLVEGSPLGIELAATLVRQRSCVEIAEALRQNYAILATTQRDMATRHRSMQAMLTYSWQLLTPAEADTLARISVFHGGFTLEAAEAVSGTTVALLRRLEAHSLLHQGDVGRYTMHELVRQYAADQLHTIAEQARQTYNQHCTYYTDFLATQQANFLNQGQTRRQAYLEIDNLRTAWQWAITQARLDALTKSVWGLRTFYRVAGFYQEAEATFGYAIARLRELMAQTAEPAPSLQRLLGALLVARAFFDIRLARLDVAGPALAEAIHYGQAYNEPVLTTDGLRLLGMVARHQGDTALACVYLEQSLALAHAHNLPDLIGGNLGDLGAIYGDRGETMRAIACYREALPFARQTQNRLLECMLVHNLGVNYLLQGNFAKALYYGQQNIQISREMDDPWLLGHAYRDTGYLMMTLGNTAYAQRYYEDALQYFRSLGSRTEEASVLYHLGALFGQMGEAPTAYDYCQQALQIIEEGQFHWHRGNAFGYLGHALVGLQQFSRAQAAYEQALAAWQKVGYASAAMEARAGLAFALFQQEEITQAQAQVEQILQDMGSIRLEATSEMANIFLICYQVLAAVDDQRALTLLNRGYELVQTQAMTIDDEGLRRSFLENVAANRELGALAKKKVDKIRNTSAPTLAD
ncbi:MAG: tetratricopeptide repeat protein, partial [Chloroflexi bacterium]|nr:tetratricopeptide repeat protein [Chloroflexota bacterium]